jgi:hypothetical protein
MSGLATNQPDTQHTQTTTAIGQPHSSSSAINLAR